MSKASEKIPEEGLKYAIDIFVNRVLSETEKNNLMIALGEAVRSTVGPTKSGLIMIYSEKNEAGVA